MTKNTYQPKDVKTIITHNGVFHCDEIFACAVISLALKDSKIRIIRTRKLEKIKKSDFVVDVGNIYNEKENKFDHHQKNSKKRKNGIPYASFGLVWKKFGKKICNSQKIANYIDQNLIQPLDAEDNGINIYKPIFNFHPFEIHNLFSLYYDSANNNEKVVKRNFLKLIKIAKFIILQKIKEAQNIEKTLKYLKRVYKKQKEKRILILEKKASWQKVIHHFPKILFVIYQKSNGDWCLEAVKKDPKLFGNKKNLPKEWGGKVNEELQKVTGVKDAIFCHKGLFLAVAKTKEGILNLASQALKHK